MIGEEDYYGALTRTSPFYCDAYKTIQDEHQSSWNEEKGIPSDWELAHSATWTYASPPARRLRVVGWKIHLSATKNNAKKILSAAIQCCVENDVVFKYLSSPSQLLQSNAKYASRSSSGKFVTIYPESDQQLDTIVRELEKDIGKEKSPYILSDIRYRETPIYFRYGGFVPINGKDEKGVDSLYIPDGRGVLVKDQRAPHFINPPVEIHRPETVKEAYRSYAEDTPSPIDCYAKIEAIYFSNGGGAYRATKENGEVTLLKEARPFAGLDRRGQAAPLRLKTEWKMLNLLVDSGIVPKPIRKFKAWEHHFIETEYLDGPSLNHWVAIHYPSLATDQFGRKSYVEQVIDIGQKIIDGVQLIHSSGYAHGDIHPSNIMMVNNQEDVRFIDFEAARPLDSDEKTTGNALGYLAPANFTPEQADWFSVSRVLASLFYPTSTIAVLSPNYWPKMLNQLSDEFGQAAKDLVTAVDDLYPSSGSGTPVFLTPNDPPSAAVTCFPDEDNVSIDNIRKFRNRLIDGIHQAKHCVPGLLYPSDVLRGNSLGYANIKTGAAGVFMSLERSGVDILDSDFHWLIDAVNRDSQRENVELGLFTGICGVAMVSAELGHNQEAEFLIDKASFLSESQADLSLESGLAGISLAMISYGKATNNKKYINRGIEICDRINARLFAGGSTLFTEEMNASQGLLRGWSGVALLNVAAAALDEDQSADRLKVAKQCINNDLAGNYIDENGIRGTVDRYNRSLPYLEKGTAGILIAICAMREYLGSQNIFSDEWNSLLKSCSASLYAFSGLYHGRAGIIAALNLTNQSTNEFHQTMNAHWKSYNSYGLLWHDELYLPGEAYLRLSCDYSTGSAGVIAAINSVIDQRWSFLPLVGYQYLFDGNAVDEGKKKGGVNDEEHY